MATGTMRAPPCRPSPIAGGATPKIITTDKPAELILFEGEPAFEDVPGTVAPVGIEHRDRTSSSTRPGSSGTCSCPAAGSAPRPEGAMDVRDAGSSRRFPEHSRGRALLRRARVRAGNVGKRRGAAEGQHSHHRARRGRLDHADGRLCRRRPVRADRGDGSRLRDEHDRDRDQGRGALFPAPGRRLVRGRHPNGPWQLAREVPEEIYRDPAVFALLQRHLCPRLRDRARRGLVQLYDGIPYGFLAWDTYVYGTGWYYPPYWYNWPGYGYPIYYPRPVTWGIGAYYNPVRGMYGRYGYAYGPYRGIAGARAWNPRTGTYARAGAAWGPQGSAGFVGAYNPRTDRGRLSSRAAATSTARGNRPASSAAPNGRG